MSNEKKVSSRGSRPLCLNNLSARVLNFIEKNPSTSFTEVADTIMEDISGDENKNSDKTTRRRVYDVLNVFYAAGIITKDSKSIQYHPLSQNLYNEFVPESEQEIAQRCREKKQFLLQKISLILSYKSLIERNQTKNRPPSAIQLPALLVGFDKNVYGGSQSALDGRKLEIHASQNPQFFSPMDVLSKIPVSVNVKNEFFQQFQYLAPMEAECLTTNSNV